MSQPAGSLAQLLAQALGSNPPSLNNPPIAPQAQDQLAQIVSSLLSGQQAGDNPSTIDYALVYDYINTKKATALTSRERVYIERYEELVAFRQKYGHCRVPHGFGPNKQLSWWVMNIRAQYPKYNAGERSWLTDERVAMLDEIKFEWKARAGKKK